ncbi:MAG: PsbP-related protein [Balneolaceae bacterium]|nr:PsbP-related protein [Balneolaceae bacterium]
MVQKTMGSSLAYIYLCERDELIPKDTFGDLMWSIEEILHQNHWEKVKTQYQESLHEKKQYSIAKDRWIPFKINQESCNSLEKAIPTLKAVMVNKWKRENKISGSNSGKGLEKVYKSSNHNFSINYPQEWNEIETAGKTVWEIQTKQNQSVANCFVRAHDDKSFKVISNEEYLEAISKDQMSKELGAFFDEYKIHEWNENAEFAGIKPTLGYNYTVKHPNSDKKESALIRQVIFDNKLYTFSCKAEREFFTTIRGTFKILSASFSFNN